MSNALHVRQIWTERLQNTKVALISKQYRSKKKQKKPLFSSLGRSGLWLKLRILPDLSRPFVIPCMGSTTNSQSSSLPPSSSWSLYPVKIEKIWIITKIFFLIVLNIVHSIEPINPICCTRLKHDSLAKGRVWFSLTDDNYDNDCISV